MNNPFLKLVLITFIIIGFSQCGVITKTRYGNGLKMDLEWGKKATSYDSTYIKKIAARKALRKRQFAEKPIPVNIVDNASQAAMSDKTLYSLPVLSQGSKKAELAYTWNETLPVNHFPVENPTNNSDTTEPVADKKDVPKIEFEKNAKIAGFIFYGSVLAILSIPLLGLLGLVGLPVGFVLAITALIRIKEAKEKENKKLKGKGLAWSIIILFTAGLALLGLLIYFILTDPGSLVIF